jgi:hypothetical protein
VYTTGKHTYLEQKMEIEKESIRPPKKKRKKEKESIVGNNRVRFDEIVPILLLHCPEFPSLCELDSIQLLCAHQVLRKLCDAKKKWVKITTHLDIIQ